MAVPSQLSAAALAARWAELPGRARQGGLPLVADAFAASRLVEVAGDVLRIQVPAAALARGGVFAAGGELAALVGRLLRDWAGAGVRWEASVLPADPIAAAAAAARAVRYAEALHHPLVKDLIARFDADIAARELADRGQWLDRLRREAGRDAGKAEGG